MSVNKLTQFLNRRIVFLNTKYSGIIDDDNVMKMAIIKYIFEFLNYRGAFISQGGNARGVVAIEPENGGLL